MKKIINNRLYNTDTARKVSDRIDYGSASDFVFYGLTLYRKRTGEFFLLRDGYRGVEDAILPQSYDEAREWAERSLDADAYEAIFGEASETGDKAYTTLSLTISAAEKARRAAAHQGITLSAYIEQLINKED